MADFAATHQPAQTRTTDPQRPSSSRPSRGPVSLTSDIARLSHIAGNRTVHQMLRSHGVQPKVAVGPVDDEFEREADHVADSVMRMPDPAAAPLQRTPVEVQRKCAACEEEEKVQRTPSAETESMSVDSSALRALDGGGRPLQGETRDYFEDRMGHDFGSVRVHTDGAADNLARSVNATAFAHGPHLVFRSGAYAPGSESGRRLLAHELTHTIQQGASQPHEGTEPSDA